MLKIDIISGFLGAGKTTFIKRLLETSLKTEKVVLIENEYGEISVDTDMLNGTNIEIKELSQGCICCSLVGDFSKSLNEVIEKFNPDRILIEPSGVGKLSDVINGVRDANLAEHINSLVCMVDAKKAKIYDKNFGEFFVDQIKNATTIVLSRMDICKAETKTTALEIIRKHNKDAVVVTTPINELTDEELIKAYEGFDVDLFKELEEKYTHKCCCGGHEHHHHEHEHHEHHHHHEHHDHHEHHHDHDENCTCGCHDHHEHHHDHDENCTCGCHDHHHHHHADEVFNSVGIETAKKYDLEYLKDILYKLSMGSFGIVVRAKGIIQALDNQWYVFNITPEELEIKEANAIAIGKIVVIGQHIDEAEIKGLF